MIDRKKFFDKIRVSLFWGSLSKKQVEGITAILDEWENRKLLDLRMLAYILATPYHETGEAMQPVLETKRKAEPANPSLGSAIARLDSSFAKGALPWVKTPYWRLDKDGKSWLGRGFVQLTHKANYLKFGITDPDDALKMDVAIEVMFNGMLKGMFTGKKLSDFFNDKGADWVGARAIINGKESADKVAGHAKKFYAALVSANA